MPRDGVELVRSCQAVDPPVYNLTGRVAECPLDEINRPCASIEPQLRVPPAEAEVERLFAGWREDLAVD